MQRQNYINSNAQKIHGWMTTEPNIFLKFNRLIFLLAIVLEQCAGSGMEDVVNTPNKNASIINISWYRYLVTCFEPMSHWPTLSW